jgi:hypothetical protein
VDLASQDAGPHAAGRSSEFRYDRKMLRPEEPVRMIRIHAYLTLAGLVALGPGCASSQPGVKEAPPLTVQWPVTGLSKVGGYRARPLGTPTVKNDGSGPAVCFSGQDDGLDVAINPLDLQTGFTIEVLFKPETGGNPTQQFLHVQDSQGGSILLEIGMGARGEFRIHSFAKVGEEARDLDNATIHRSGIWYWAALTYSEEVLRLYLNGQEQASAPIAMRPMTSGQMGIGYKLSEENWFRGCIREVRFANQALAPEKLARTD